MRHRVQSTTNRKSTEQQKWKIVNKVTWLFLFRIDHSLLKTNYHGKSENGNLRIQKISTQSSLLQNGAERKQSSSPDAIVFNLVCILRVGKFSLDNGPNIPRDWTVGCTPDVHLCVGLCSVGVWGCGGVWCVMRGGTCFVMLTTNLMVEVRQWVAMVTKQFPGVWLRDSVPPVQYI